MRPLILITVAGFVMASQAEVRRMAEQMMLLQQAGGRGPSAAEQARRRSLQQQIPGGATQKEWNALERYQDKNQPLNDRGMGFLELSAKRATGQITEDEFQESMDVLYGLLPGEPGSHSYNPDASQPPPKQPRR